MTNVDIRWQQRFVNFERAFLLLKKTILIKKPTEVERGGLIQFFNMAYELSWKVLKDYLEAEGYILNSPRETIKQAFQSGLIKDGEKWLNALKDRNFTSHAYDDKTAKEIEHKIKDEYFNILEDLYKVLKPKMS